MRSAPREEDPRARDVLGELRIRTPLGDRLVARLGARGWSPPRFSRRGRRLYERCGVPDPWDPDAPPFDIALGDVGLAARTPGSSVDPSGRRAPAPHAAPPAEKAAPAAASFRPSIPGASSKEPTGRPAPKIGDRRPDDTAEMKKKLLAKPAPAAAAIREPVRVQQPVRALPVRPDLAERGAARDPSREPPSPAAPARVVRPSTPGAPLPRVSLPSPQRGSSGPIELPMAARVVEPEEDSLGPGDFIPVRRPEPAPPVTPTETRGVEAPAPRFDPSPPPERPAPVAAPAPRPPSAPPPQPARTPPRAGTGNLDDLFGMGGADQTRVRFDRPVVDESRPRRPRVSDPASLAGGVDRRPPPPKPPPGAIPPSGGPPPTDREGEDE